MKQFDLETYIKNSERRVVTRDGREVKIAHWDRSRIRCVDVVIDGVYYLYHEDGTMMDKESKLDLFFADKEEETKSNEIYLESDRNYEFVKDTYIIPEGCEARIEGNMVIIERVQKEEELTEFEKVLAGTISDWQYKKDDPFDEDNADILKRDAENLLEYVKKELERLVDGGDITQYDAMLINHGYRKGREAALNESNWKDSMRKYKDAYEQGKADALKDFLKWKEATEHKDLEKHIAILEDGKVLLSNYLEKGDYYIDLEDLKTLPKEE